MPLTRRLIGGLALAAVAVGTGGLTQAAQARTASNGAFYQVVDTCDRGYHTLNIDLAVRSQPGWASQYVAIRSYVRDVSTGASQVTDWKVIPATQGMSTVQVGGYNYIGPATTRIWHQFQWWNGQAWTADTGWVEDYYSSSSYGANLGGDTACRT